ncbi:PucR family transcriptional regulator [Leifsonia sp. McL0607]|uniref:PucR family transcriptional regulator n=1 Tax=Leifsonia sp. McL0607 TaxID=3415672 RepID=UPI003CF7CBBA
MRVMDLLENPALRLELRSPVPASCLERSITGCAQSELMDPSAFLTRGEFVLTLGMGLHFEDLRTWDAYVERLVRAGASGLGFGLGAIHSTLPTGLVRSCADRGLPLIELGPDFPLVKLSRHIWQELAADRYLTARRGWDLANECTQLAAEGATPALVLERVSASIEANVRLVDESGFTLARAGQFAFAPGSGTRTALPLPGGDQPGFQLRVETESDALLLQPLLGPTLAVIAMQLSYTLFARSPLHSHTAARFVEALLDGRTASAETVRLLAVDAGFDPGDPFDLIILRRPERMSSALLRLITWRMRVLFEQHYRCVRFYDESYQATLVMQGRVDAERVPSMVKEAIGRATTLDAGYASGFALEELGITIQVARRAELEAGVHQLQTLDLGALVGALPTQGLTGLARRSLAPLLDGEDTLLCTLVTYLELNGSTRAVCDRLFIHRNTLTYRLQRIEQLIQADLSDGRTRATLLLAAEITGVRA